MAISILNKYSDLIPKQPPTLSPEEFTSQASGAADPRAWKQVKAAWQGNPYRQENPTDWRRLQDQFLYGNPVAAQADTETAGPRHGLWGRIKQTTRETPAFSHSGRLAMAKIAAFVLGAQALGTASAGAGGAGGSGFVAGGGGGPALATPSSSLSGGGLLAKLLGKQGGSMASEGGGGMWGELLKTGVGTLLGSALNKQQAPGKDLSRAPFESGDLQRYLPAELRAGQTGPMIGAGVQGIGELLRNPGGLAPNVAEAINPRLSAESANIAQNFRNLQSNQAGAAARGNLPVSLKGALSSALDVAQERAQRGARSEAMTQSETLRRSDLEQVFNILNAILQFQQAGRGTATAGIGAGTALQSQQNAATMALLSSLLTSGAQGNA